MTDTRGAVTDPSVCYRHPGRQSWVLCQRCGRTVCPECQILAPVGVHCPECVRETSGGTSWRPAGGAAQKPRRRRTGGSSSLGRARSMLLGRSAAGTPVVTYGLLGANALLLVVGLVTGGLPVRWLAALPGTELQVWRFVTAGLVPASAIGLLLGGLFLYLTGPQVEGLLGTRRYAAVLVVGTIAGSCAAVLAGGVSAGLTAPLFAAFAAILVIAWNDERARVQILVMLGINALLTIVLGGPGGLALLVGALLGGAGTTWVLQSGGDRGWTPNRRTATIVGCTAGLVLLTVLKGLVV